MQKKRTFFIFLILPGAFLSLIISLLFFQQNKSAYPPGQSTELQTADTPMVIPEKQPAEQQNQSNRDLNPDKETLMGITSPSEDSLLVEIAPEFANRPQMYMNKMAYLAFRKMHSEAKKEGIQLTIISAFRSFDHQKRIWENKWNGIQPLTGNINAAQITDPHERALEILKFSAMPATSRHHWGTDIDLNSLNNDYFLAGKGKEEYEWLKKNAHKFGFCQPYTSKNKTRQTGYEEEKWHWSYMPVSTIYMENFIGKINYSDILGFDGWQTAKPLNVINNYVLSINKTCQEWEKDLQQEIVNH
ncbi:MAG: M15 family metallopeptidase [Bacteroidota bacterium]